MGLAPHPLRAAVPPIAADRGPPDPRAGADRGLRRLPQPVREPEASVRRRRRDAPRPHRRSPDPRRPGAGRGRAAAADRGAQARRSRVDRGRRDRRTVARAHAAGARRLLRTVRRGLRVRHARGLRRATSGGHAHRQRRPARVRAGRRDGHRGSAGTPRDRGGVRPALPDRALAAKLGDAGRARVETEIPDWPEVVERLLA